MSVTVYSWGMASLSACAPNDMSVEDVTRSVNISHPTGISSKWELSDEKQFRGGEPMPCVCESNPGKLHYLFHC